VVWSFVYLALCRLLQLVVLLGRSEPSKELEILLLRQELAICAGSSGERTFVGRRPGDPGCARTGAAAKCVDELVGASGDAAALAPAAREAALDVSAPTPRTPVARS
jgi:hypothetical protein